MLHRDRLHDLEVNFGWQEEDDIREAQCEAKVREKRQMRAIRKEQRLRDADAAGEVSDQPEDLSHLDVAEVAGVEPEGTTINR